MVFGPSAEKRAIAQGTVIREFPRCPICKATYGYEVSGSSLDHFKCNTCQTKWQTEPLADGHISSMTLVQPSGYDLRGIELTGIRYQSDFYKNFDGQYGAFLKNYRSQMTAKLSSTVSLEISEETVWAWPGSSMVRLPSVLGSLASQAGISQIAEHAGHLFLTSERLIWLQDGMFNFEIPLEELASFTPASAYQGSDASIIVVKSAKRNVEGWLRLWLWYGSTGNVEVARDNRAFNRVRGMVFRQQEIKRERIQKEKQRDHVQVVLDFSSLRETLAKGGVVATTLTCPQCSGPLHIPEAGRQTICKYCGASIRPVDLFDKIKSLVG